MEKMEPLKSIAADHGLALVYIFGSQVNTGLDILMGKRPKITDPLTDIDIGVVFKKLPPPRKRFELYSAIHNRLEEHFLPYPVDLVFLEETHSVFQSNAICGRCLYYCSLDYKENYEENILRRAADFRPFLERYLDEVLGEV